MYSFGFDDIFLDVIVQLNFLKGIMSNQDLVYFKMFCFVKGIIKNMFLRLVFKQRRFINSK